MPVLYRHPLALPTALMAAVAAAACAPAVRIAPPVPAALTEAPDTVGPRNLRPVPVPASYRAAQEKGTRSATGRPGARYWQNRVRYRIEAELDPATARLRGTERVVLHNRSPERLDSLLLNLYPNVFTGGVPRNRTIPFNTSGITLERVAVQGTEMADRTGQPAGQKGYRVRGTLGWVNLPRPVAPGDSVVMEVAWHLDVPPKGGFRTGWEDALGGRVLQVAQWYPQVAVFDDVHGWDATPYLGDGEFYLEYGDFDVALTLPANHLVGATGTLQNPDEVLTPETRRRLAAAVAADAPQPVVTEADLAARRATLPGRGGKVTWRFRAEDVRDFGFATSGRYVWDAVGAVVPGEDGTPRRVAVHSLYRPGAPGWALDAARYGEHTIEYLSRKLVPYRYPQVTVSEGPIFGMEYPMLVFIARPERAEDLQAVIAHEEAHQWFPMMVGQNEAAYAWMDEGFTQHHEDLAHKDFYPRSDPFADSRASYLRVAGTEAEVPLMRHTDLVSPYGARTVAAYTKPAAVLRALRGVVGDSVVDDAMRTYAREWMGKHPYPWDFFATVERVAGRNLGWFFYPWWFETGVLDQAVGEVRQDGETLHVTVHDLGQNPMPALVAVTVEGGATILAEVPVESWFTGVRTAEVSVPVSGRVTRVEIDPAQLFPDANRSNNVWTAPGQ
jgi:hypothetical protein